MNALIDSDAQIASVKLGTGSDSASSSSFLMSLNGDFKKISDEYKLDAKLY
jgi:hypothetical protein